jgi:UDP-N-acetylmuramate--alanine ligase
MDILNLKKVYLIGIKGVGVCALAKILKDLGIKVVGSDTEEKFFTDEVLKKEKIKYYEGFNEKNLEKELPLSLVVSSVAYLLPSSKNPEIEYAKKLNLPIYSYPEALAKIFNESFGIAICGSHGKSSTTAVLGKFLKDLNLEPTVLVGSEVIEWKSNSLVGKNFLKKIKFMKENLEKLKDLNWVKKNLNNLPLFVIEADEYRSAFLNYFPRVIILTNVDLDHPDYFKNEKEYKEAYLKFIKNLKEPKILITHSDFPLQKDVFHIKAKKLKKKLPFPIPGKHFQKNLQLLNAFRETFSLPYSLFLKSLKNYKGIKRRFEIIKKEKNLVFIDDYAHHPTEVLSFYKSLKEKFPNFKKIIVFQPHTFTRTHFLFNEFLKAFRKIKKDKKVELIIFKTFPSAREKDLIEKIKNLKTEKDLAKKLNLNYFENVDNLISYLRSKINSEKKLLISSVGAGDIYKIFENLP